MPPHATPTPTKYCEWCAEPFVRSRVGKNSQLECVGNFMKRRFCSISCSVSRQHAKAPQTAAASRKRAQKFVSGSCEACGHTRNLVVHHVDGDPKNNLPPNLQTLCSPCHSYWHAMLRRTGRRPEERMPRLVVPAYSEELAMPSSRKSRRSSSAPTSNATHSLEPRND